MIATLRRRLAHTYADLRSWSFDVRHRVETRGIHEIDTLTVVGDHAKDAVEYGPVYPEEMKEILCKVVIDFSQYTFVDFGSGKGRAMFMASNYPFRRIVGVEFARELHEIACRNIRTYHCPNQQCFDITSIHGDATEFELPDGPVVLYFNNPFRGPVMEAVVGNVKRSLETAPRPALILSYGRWTLNNIIERLPGIALRSRGRFYSIYQVPPCLPKSHAS
jgi:hypothetical protein